MLAGVPAGLPALTRAAKLTARAARVGFDWPDAEAVLAKLDEEVAELRAELPAARSGSAGRRGRRPAVRAGQPRDGSWTSTPKPACATPTRSSPGASTEWSKQLLPKESHSPKCRLRRWSRNGRK